MLYGRLTKSQWFLVAFARSLYGKGRAKKFASKYAEQRIKTHCVELKWETIAYGDDWVIEKIGFDFVFISEDWEEFYDSYCYKINSWYDCTGKYFTVWMKKFTVNGKTIIYRKNAIDC